MKKNLFSIKIRVTLWYTFMVTSLALLMLYVLVTGVSRAANLYHEELLTHAMADASEQVRYTAAIPQLDSSSITDFDKVSFALFNAEGSLWHGHWPFFEAPFSDGEIRQAEADDRIWLFQDLLLPFAQGDLWLRGYLPLDSMYFLRREALSWFWVLLPCLILFAAIGGYLLTKRAFRRIVQMAKQADGIAGGKDLSQRFPVNSTGETDEFGMLAQTFNRMLGRLEASFARERQFTDDASHELRTPISVIQTACSFALSQEDPQEWQEALELIQGKAESMGSMVSQLLQLARMDGGRVALASEAVDMTVLCRNVAHEMEAASGRNIVQEQFEEDVVLTGDELLLMRVVINLLDNALRHAKSCIVLSLCQNEEAVILSVADDGPGMSPETAAHVFERFYQAETDRSHPHSGTGLGLAMVQSIVQLHGGSVCVESAPGLGAKFRVSFPQKNE